MATSNPPATHRQRHALQRLESPSIGISLALHLQGLWTFYTGFSYLVDNPNFINTSYGWHMQYLTILALTLSTTVFTLALLADLTSSSALFVIKNYTSIIATPFEILISILYWGLRSINPILVIPPDLPPLSLRIDFTFHLMPAVYLCFDYLFLSPPWPSSPVNPHAAKITLLISVVFCFGYWFWIELCYSKNGFYPYPIFEMLNTAQRVGLFCFSGVVMWGVSGALRKAYGWLNGVEGVGDGNVKRVRRGVLGRMENQNMDKSRSI